MLSSTLLGAFTTPVTYVLIVILLATAVMQVRYVNKALQCFNSTQVIPIQFVMFTLCVIIGSAVLYRDFERTTAEQAVKFVGGCLLTFFGVFLITSGRHGAEEDDDRLSDADGIEGNHRACRAGRPRNHAPNADSNQAPRRRVAVKEIVPHVLGQFQGRHPQQTHDRLIVAAARFEDISPGGRVVAADQRASAPRQHAAPQHIV